jgi:NTP pyrophosphatase (non-canonical NTP hydrolase)
VKELKEKIKKYIEERGWSILKNPGSIAKSISIESAELLEIFQWEDFSPEKITTDKKLEQKIKDELADVLIYAAEMAISLDLDIEQIMKDKLEKNSQKYPVEAIKGNHQEYLNIKESHRQGE